jgi:hypothetical protein
MESNRRAGLAVRAPASFPDARCQRDATASRQEECDIRSHARIERDVDQVGDEISPDWVWDLEMLDGKVVQPTERPKKPLLGSEGGGQ